MYMENWLVVSETTIIKVVLSVISIFTVMIVITRINGLRTFAKMSSFDFAATIAIGSVLASIVLNTNQSLVKGTIALACIVAFQSIFSWIRRKSKAMQHLISNDPVVLMYQGEIFYENLKKTNVGEDDLIAKLREANALNFKEVYAVVLETTGDMSVLHGPDHQSIDKRILKGIKGWPTSNSDDTVAKPNKNSNF